MTFDPGRRLLLLAGLRHLKRRPWQPILSIVGVALGVAMVVGVDLANESAQRTFESGMEAVGGRASHELTAGVFGFSEEVYLRLRSAGVRGAAPIVEGDAGFEEGGSVHVLGIDPFAEAPFARFAAVPSGSDLERLLTEPGAVLATASTAKRLKLEAGVPRKVFVHGFGSSVVLAGLIEPAREFDRLALENVLVADISTAQEVLRYEGRLTRIDLKDPDLDRVRPVLPPGVEIQTAGARTSAQASMTRGFRLNLTALSFLSLLVGMFLIYNTMTFAVVQRREAIGVLRGLGVTGREVFVGVLAEAVVVGLIGTVLGLVLGVALGRGLVGMVTRTINDLYFVLSVGELRLSTLSLVKGVVLGLGATVVSAVLPGWEAASVPPRTAWLRSMAEDRMRRLAPVWAATGTGLLGLAGALVLLPGRNIHVGLFSMLFLTVGFAMWVPVTMLIVDPFARRLFGTASGILGRLAAGGVTASMSRTVPAIAALTVSVAVVIAMGSMIRSFRRTVDGWLQTHLPADVYVSAPSLVSGRPAETLETGLDDLVRHSAGVASIVRFRTMRVDLPTGPAWLVAADRHPSQRSAFPLKGGDPATVWSAYERGDLLVSEPLAFRLKLAAGGLLTLRTDKGPRAFRIAGIFYDYASDQGAIIVDRAAFEAWWDDRGVSSIGVFAAPGQASAPLVERLRESASRLSQRVLIRSTGELRAASLEVFDRTFQITSVLRILAMTVSFIGVLSSLMALQLEKERELAVLRANGLTPGQLWALVTTQTGLMGLTAGLLALPLGWATTAFLIHVINKRSFNWSIQMFMDPAAVAQSVALAVAAALLAGVYPAWKMARTSPARALRAEA